MFNQTKQSLPHPTPTTLKIHLGGQVADENLPALRALLRYHTPTQALGPSPSRLERDITGYVLVLPVDASLPTPTLLDAAMELLEQLDVDVPHPHGLSLPLDRRSLVTIQ